MIVCRFLKQWLKFDLTAPAPSVCWYTLIRVSWAASGSLLKFRLYDFNDYDDDWARF